MSFFVISTGGWGVLADEFIRRMRARWPTVAIREVQEPEGEMCLYFDLRMPHSLVDGGLDRAGQSFHFDSSLRDAAQLALWFRSLAPESVPLFFCDESMGGMLELEPGTTEADIFRAFDYIPAPPGWMNYDLIPQQGWGMPLQVLALQLQRHWPSARLMENEDPDSHWRFVFHVPMTHSEVSGRFARETGTLVFTGDPRDCASFALWCRSVVPTDQLLLTCDQGSLYLEADTTEERLLGTLHAKEP
ncbi:YceI family protein [Archangium sp.]|uniref:YceI family protein n=1 Tax=Archangium sp. TaxID=1872627 RepID=UPI00286AC9D4|nr:YceI family protein [Archangium sp.]